MIAAPVFLASNFFSRLCGLITRKALTNKEGLIICGTDSIHTFFMRYGIDAIFMDRGFKVLSVCLKIKPFRVILPVKGAFYVLELREGSINPGMISAGDTMVLRK